jgi:3',5'-cyclic AMP phosphodiesterase CpdA
VEALLRLVRQPPPDLVVVSGSGWQRARRSQFRAAREFVTRWAAPETLVLSGNHDIPLFNMITRICA